MISPLNILGWGERAGGKVGFTATAEGTGLSVFTLSLSGFWLLQGCSLVQVKE